MEGWIKVHRKFKDHWLMKTKLCRAAAWLDLLMMAAHEDHKFLFDGNVVEIQRGGIITSILKLSKRWNWSRTKTKSYLELLENENMIIKKIDTKKTLITICNYDTYQEKKTSEKHQKSN
jgi:DNA replication protein DnaD